jgi:uncharacterized RDD family membrane protein YckC
VKCPKCSYLGFETGDRCRNCGYDFSLIAIGDPRPLDADLELRSVRSEERDISDWPLREATVPRPAPPAFVSRTEPARQAPVQPGASAPKPRLSHDPKLPLFTRGDKGDEPLIKLPVTPRPPLAVRRTPDSPRLQVVSRAVRAVERDPPLEFEGATRTTPEPVRDESAEVTPADRVSRVPTNEVRPAATVLGAPMARVVAAAIDHALLAAIDVAVIYFTLRISGLVMSEWATLPAAPLVLFLLLLKLAYFSAFTTVGGQTIGKMALRIRVVTEDHRSIDAASALRRAAVGAVSTVLLGLGLLPAFFDAERRAFHDRVARTRVVALRTV